MPVWLGAGRAALVQTVGNESARAFEKLSIFLVERIRRIALGIDHSYDAPVIVCHRDDDLRARGVECRQIARVFGHITDDNWLARLEHRSAQALRDRKTRICRRLVASAGQNHKVFIHDLVNANPTVIARRANQLQDLPDSFLGASASQRESADLLEFLASRFLHSRESNLVEKKTSASGISNFAIKFFHLVGNNVGKARIGPDRWRIEERAVVDLVGITPKNFAVRRFHVIPNEVKGSRGKVFWYFRGILRLRCAPLRMTLGDPE